MRLTLIQVIHDKVINIMFWIL